MTTMETRIFPFGERIADDLVERMLARGAPAELVGDFALPLPITVICELLGVPLEDRGDFRVWSDAFLSTTRYRPEQVTEYVGRLRDYVAGLVAERRQQARDDLISALVAARDDDDRLSEDELLSLCEGILVAGHETTASQIPNFTPAFEPGEARHTPPDEAAEAMLRLPAQLEAAWPSTMSG